MENVNYQRKKSKKIHIMLISSLLIVTMLAFQVNAEFWACFGKGDYIDYCNPAIPDRTCTSSYGCIYCMSNYDALQNCYSPGNFNACNNLPFQCNPPGSGEGSIDQDPPEIILNSPVPGAVYDSLNVLVDMEVDEKSNVNYMQHDGRIQWNRLCVDCYGFTGIRRFIEGVNNITFRARDAAGNDGFHNVVFLIDTRAPQILSTEPLRGSADGTFLLRFREANPIDIKLFYGAMTDWREMPLMFDEDCFEERGITTCTVDADITDYAGMKIEYWFGVSDIAGYYAESRRTTLSVESWITDFDPPVITLASPIDGAVYSSNSVLLDITTDEMCREIMILDNDDPRERWTRLCMDCNSFNRARRFSEGLNNITIMAIDYAGNTAYKAIEFITDSRPPRIVATDPRRGFANGDFHVDFREDNPVSLILYYGTPADIRASALSISDECYADRTKTVCQTSVDIDDFDGAQIEYWFDIEDIAGGKDSSRPIRLDVDTTYPVINNPDSMFNVDRRNVFFSIDVTEDNLDSVSYIDYSEGDRARERRLCTRLTNGLCERRQQFRVGEHELDIMVSDKAGNMVAERVVFHIY